MSVRSTLHPKTVNPPGLDCKYITAKAQHAEEEMIRAIRIKKNDSFIRFDIHLSAFDVPDLDYMNASQEQNLFSLAVARNVLLEK